MKFKVFFVVFSALLITACARSPRPFQPEPTSHYKPYSALTNAAQTSTRTLTQLGATEQAAYPPQTVVEPPNPATYGMAKSISISWIGPIKPLLQRIANTTNYSLRVVGIEPPIPVLVNINAKHQPIGNILRDASYQAGNKANVVVFPISKVIELRYANS